MLVASNATHFSAETEIFPMIIDYDVRNGDKLRVLEELNLYEAIHKGIYNGKTTFTKSHPHNGFFSTNMMQMKEKIQGNQPGKSTFNFQYSPDLSSKKYSDSLGYTALNGEMQLTKQLLETLYNTDTNQEFAELHIDTTVGFRGNPNIGSVMLNDIENKDEFKEFRSLCNGDVGDRVVIIGSLFGGTGSSGIPVLVNAIRNSAIAGVRNARISTILVCPYFKIASPNDNDRSKGVIDDKIFESKTKAALYFYENSLNNKIDAIYYVGDRFKASVEHNVGEEKQKNPAHVVELISALAIGHFSELKDADFAVTDPNLGNILNKWKFGLPDEIEGVKDLDLSMFKKVVKEEIEHLVSFAVAGKYIDDVLLAKSKEVSELNFYQLPGFSVNDSDKNDVQKNFKNVLDNFMKFFGMFKEWSDELKMDREHRLLTFDFEAKNICDLISTHPFRKEKTNIIGKMVSKPTLETKDISAGMSDIFKRTSSRG